MNAVLSFPPRQPAPTDEAFERASCSPFALSLWMSESFESAEGHWIDWPQLERKLLRGQELSNDELIVLLFNASGETALRARHKLLERRDCDPRWLGQVREFERAGDAA